MRQRPLLHPVLQIGLLGLCGWIAYLHLAITYPLPAFVAKYPLTDLGRSNGWNAPSLVDFVLTLSFAFFSYLLAWRIARRHPRAHWLFGMVVGFAVLDGLTFLLMYPVAATDVFEYVFHSRILTQYGQNPLAVAPIAFKGDPFLKTVNWAVQPSPYGPLWVILTVPGSLIARNDLLSNLLWMRGIAVLFYVGCVLMVGAILRKHEPEYKIPGTLLFAWNPLILFEAAGNAHNGVIMMFLALLSFFLILQRKWEWVIPALVGSVLVKYSTALLLPPVLFFCLKSISERNDRLRFLLTTTLASAVILTLLFLPFLAVPSGLLYEADFVSLLAAPTIAYYFLWSIQGERIARSTTIALSALSYIAVYVAGLAWTFWSHRSNVQFRTLVLLGTWMLLGYLLIGSMHFQPWFVLWPISLGLWINHTLTRHVLLTLSASSLLSYAANYFWIWNIRVWRNPEVNLMFVLVIFGPPLLFGFGSWVWERRHLVGRVASVSTGRA